MTVSAPGGPFDPVAGCGVCGRPGPVTVGELDLVTDREQRLWAVLDRTDTMAVAGIPQHNRRASDVARLKEQTDEAMAERTAAKADLAGHLDHLIAQYSELATVPFWFLHGLGQPSGRLNIAEWAIRARLMLAYRRRYGFTDPLRPLGEKPADGSARGAQWSQLMQGPPPVW